MKPALLKLEVGIVNLRTALLTPGVISPGKNTVEPTRLNNSNNNKQYKDERQTESSPVQTHFSMSSS